VYRFKPRQNDAVNESWICDAGRFSYKAINDNRVLRPMRRQDGALQPTSWQEAIRQTAEALQAHRGEAVGVVVAPQGTNEDFYLLKQLLGHVSEASRVWLFAGALGDEDDLLIRADKNPNTRGAQEIGFPEPAVEPLTDLTQAIDQGAVKVHYAIDTDLEAALGAESVSRLASQLECLIVQTSNQRPGWDQAHVVLPSASYAERDGTFTNFQGRVQRLNPAFAPHGEAMPAWQIYQRIAQALGQHGSYASAEAVLTDLATAIPAYNGMSYAKIGDSGQLISVGALTE
jgi:NADH-quinone oxidoreductase subunit G